MASRFLTPLFMLCFPLTAWLQDQPSLSGSLEANANFFMKDEKIGAANTPQYERQLFGGEAWVNLNYRYKGFDVGVRFDLFNNSNLLNPQDSYTAQGIGRWYITKQIQDLEITAGYIYDQIGSGIIFRAYEERPLLIDNALLGLRVGYNVGTNWFVKGFMGKQKRQFETYGSTIKGFSVEGFIPGGEEGQWSLAPGVGIVNKTLSDNQMDALANTLSTYSGEDFIEEAPFNTYSFSVFNTLSAGPVTWYAEVAYKTEEVFYDLFEERVLATGDTTIGSFVLEPGHVVFSSINFVKGNFGGLFEFKRIKNFNFRADPFASLNRGIINFLPHTSRLNTYRLTARYVPATQDLGEQAIQLEARYAPNRNLSFLTNFSTVENLDSDLLYRELFTEVIVKKPFKWTFIGGIQFQQYDQELFEGKPGVPKVKAITPYVDYLYKFDRKKSIRAELQYMHTKQDYGSWLYGLVEYSIVPHWIFELSDMWNVAPYEDEDGMQKTDALHYPTVGVVYSTGSNRFSLRYVKQVEGVVCSSGICRLEPAFSGVRFNILSQF